MIKKRKYINILIVFVLTYFGYYTWHRYQKIYPPYAPELVAVLRLAGENRPELEKVLERYSRNAADSLKLRAAKYLIVNMPGKYSEEYVSWDNFEAAYRRWDKMTAKQHLIHTYELDRVIIKEDVKHITSEYLMNNIDLAFHVWQQQPWGKYISFDTFCEEILPYRIHTEPLENWREKAQAGFADMAEYFKKHPDITAVQACSAINTQLDLDWQFSLVQLPSMNYSMLMASPRGTCDQFTTLAVFVMRAFGIPVTIEVTPRWPNKNAGHAWNAVCDSSGKHISFLGAEVNPGDAHIGITAKKSKVYRLTFANWKNIIDRNSIPPLLRNSNIKDVTHEYTGFIDVEVPVLWQEETQHTGYAYLAVPYDGQWTSVCWGSIEQKNILFPLVGKKIIYMPVYYTSGEQNPANYPFILNEDGSTHFFKPDFNHLQNAKLSEVFPAINLGLTRMLHGRFEGANNLDFSDARVLYTIDSLPSYSYNVVKLKNQKAYRYIRYMSSRYGYSNVAELAFYGKKNKKLSGKAIGMPDNRDNPEMTFNNAYDGDRDTFFDSGIPSGSWTGLDFGEAKTISEIHFLPRHENNGIYLNDFYELFYWNDTNWESLGRQVAKEDSLKYQIPSNALFYLKNMTKNKGGRIFLIQDGMQKWI